MESGRRIRKKLNKKSMVWIFAWVLAGCIGTVVWLATTGNDAQIYTDAVIEYTAIFSSNKSAERWLIYVLIFSGIFLISIYLFLRYKSLSSDLCETGKKGDAKMLICMFGVMAGSYYFIHANTNSVLTVSLLIFLFSFVIEKSLVVPIFVFFYINIYALYGIFRIWVLAGREQPANSMTAAMIMFFVVCIILLVCTDKKTVVLRGCLLGQLAVPFVLLIYLASKYNYNGELLNIPAPLPVKILIYSLIVLFEVEGVWKIKKNWHTDVKIKSIISYGTCVCIMAFNRFSGTGAVVPNDIHHPFENIIGYSQIFELGQDPFSEYIPVSGMYSIVQGAVFQLFGNGEMGNYYVAQNVFYLLILLLVAVLLCAQVDRVYVFVISCIFSMFDYNRFVFVLPVMLLLMMPKLIERKNLWLKAWFLTSLFQGLYYPVYGASVCLSFLPLGICQIADSIKSGQMKADMKTVKFWIGWGICFVAAFICLPYLIGTFRHVSAMSGQTIYADGLARFGQKVPEWFFPYMEHDSGIRIALYDVFSFMIPAGFVWSAYVLALKAGGVCIRDGKLKFQNIQALAITASTMLMPAVCYLFTFVRLDFGTIYSRSFGVLIMASVLLFVAAQRYLIHQKVCCLAFFLLAFIPATENGVGFFSSDTKLEAYTTVPEGYVYIENDDIEKWGTCFAEPSLYDSVKTFSEQLSQEDKKYSYLGWPDWFGSFYLCGIKGDGVMEIIPTIRGYDAVQEAIDVARANKTRIGSGIHPLYNYYLYHWLLTSGEYLWSEEQNCFLPNDGEDKFSAAYVKEKHKNLMLFQDGMDVGKSAASLGMSLDSLKKIMTVSDAVFTFQQKDSGMQINFEEPLDGNVADYLYLEFSGLDQNFRYTLYDMAGEQEQDGDFLAKLLMKKNYNPGVQVTVQWSDENEEQHTMNCAVNQGKLLVPLGAGAKWLLNKHTYLYISVTKDGQQITLPNISDIRFFKLREAG